MNKRRRWKAQRRRRAAKLARPRCLGCGGLVIRKPVVFAYCMACDDQIPF